MKITQQQLLDAVIVMYLYLLIYVLWCLLDCLNNLCVCHKVI
jgi:hypothetical protein